MENGPRREKRLSFFLILILAGLAAGIIVAGYSYYRNYAKNYWTAVEQQLAAISDLKVGELAQWRKERLGDAAVFYGNTAFSALVRRYFEKPNDSEASGQLRSWLQQFQEHLLYDRVFLLDAQGVARMAVPDTPEPVAAHLLKEAPEIIRSGRTVFSDFHRDAPDRPIHLSVLVPILGGGTDRRGLGILVLRIDPRTYLYPLISLWPAPSRTAETLLVRREGNDVLYLNELKYEKNIALNLRIPLDKIEEPAVKAVLGREGVVEGKDYRGVPVLADLRAIPDSPWFLVARLDRAEIHASLRERLWVTIIFVGALLLGASTAVGFIWRQQRVRSYRERTKAAEALTIQRRIAEIFLTISDDEMFNKVLKVILEVMQSPFGVFGYIDEDGALVVPIMTRQIWDRCQVPEKTFTFPRNTWSDSSWPRALRGKRVIYSNQVSTQIPEGHVDIQRHISMPILFQEEVIGLFQVANKETDYTEADIRSLEIMAGHVAPILLARLRRKQAEVKLEQTISDLERSNKELEQFAYVASHDLQEPLRMVASYTQLLAERYEGRLDDKAKKCIDYAVDGAVRMQTLINDLLTYSRVGTRGKPFEPTDAHSVLGEAIKNLAAAIEQSRTIITNDDLPTVRADASQLVQLFQNLIANSIKFHGKDIPRVHVSAQDHGREWVFSIRDNGIGIESQYADRVFLIFQRLHTRQEYPGTGIGLAICKRIVERHGGKIWFESEPGKGSTFFFAIPK
jgi:signal transduction histidine kinase